MIPVSQDFKNAIKSRERQIKGYVELIISDRPTNFSATATTTYPQVYTSVDNIIDESPIKEGYGTLDSLPLDGSCKTMSDTLNDNAPFIFVSDMDTIEVDFTETTTEVITFIFGEMTPIYTMVGGQPYIYDIFKLTANIYNGATLIDTKEATFNDGEVRLDLGNPTAITKVVFNVENSDVVIPNKRYYMPRVNQVIIGDTKIIKDNDLVEFTIDEEISKLVEETPINETSIIIPRPSEDSYLSTKFLQNMNEKTKIIPYIGVKLESGAIEYVKMGEFYFDSVVHNKDKTCTINGNNIFRQFQEQTIIDDNETDFLSRSSMDKQQFESWLENYPYVFNTIDWEHNINTWGVQDLDFTKFLSEVAFANWDIFYADRDSEINIRHINTTPVDTLSKSEVFDNVILEKIPKINTIELVRIYEAQTQMQEEKKVYESSITLSKEYEMFVIISNGGNLLNASFSVSGNSASDIAVITKGYYIAFVMVSGTIGDTINITAKTYYNSEQSNSIYTMTNKAENEKEVKLTFESFANMLPLYYINNSPILNMTPSYQTKFEYNGDPSLEAGDYINVELEDGTLAPIFIQKNHFRFDGGLEGHIEGVE